MKIRNGYVSNSSTSSFIISCLNEEIAMTVIEAYNKLIDYWFEIHPNEIEDKDYLNGTYRIASPKEIIEDFSYNVSPIEKPHLIKQFEEIEKNGRVLLLGSCSNEYNMSEYMIMNMFNEYVLNSLKDNNGKYLDAEIVFDKRWS